MEIVPTFPRGVRLVGKPHLTPPELEPDIVLTEPQPRHRTPPAWMRLWTPFGDRRRWQRSVCTGWQNW